MLKKEEPILTLRIEIDGSKDQGRSIEKLNIFNNEDPLNSIGKFGN